MIYGYARVSTKGQAKDGNSLEAQTKALKEAGAEIIFKDSFTGTKSDRPEFSKLIEILEDGDKLIVTKLDRFARSATQGAEIMQKLLDRNISVHILNMGQIDNTPTGKLIRNIFFAFADTGDSSVYPHLPDEMKLCRRSSAGLCFYLDKDSSAVGFSESE